jgi:hypothetical protein
MFDMGHSSADWADSIRHDYRIATGLDEPPVVAPRKPERRIVTAQERRNNEWSNDPGNPRNAAEWEDLPLGFREAVALADERQEPRPEFPSRNPVVIALAEEVQQLRAELEAMRADLEKTQGGKK